MSNMKEVAKFVGLRQRGVADEKRIAEATYSAFIIWKQRYPLWRDAMFDEHFLAQRILPWLTVTVQNNIPLDPAVIVQTWLHQFRLTDESITQLESELTPAADDFIYLFESEYRAQTVRRASDYHRLMRTITWPFQLRWAMMVGGWNRMRYRWVPSYNLG